MYPKTQQLRALVLVLDNNRSYVDSVRNIISYAKENQEEELDFG